ncbi:hypothetical protein B0O99DRAFT_516673 [Bisporella sp. PMI_857]|nr:hypothetical protein B0O99DRAFT_516673 [Bisporella sp. PMI_857]
MFSGLLKSSSQSSTRRRSRSSSQSTTRRRSLEQNASEAFNVNDSLESRYLRGAEQLAPIESEPPDLRDLNNSLAALAAIFPDVQVEVFREMLSNFAEESRLEVVTETLLKHKMTWVKGRYRVPSKDKPEVARDDGAESRGHVSVEDKFRSPEYKKAVRTVTYHEFKGLSRSTINAVLAEFNHSYTLAHPTLVTLAAKSWRFSISSLFLRRKTVSSQEAEHHPLVVWQSTGQGSIVPAVKSTGSAELDKELYDTLIAPIQTRLSMEREDKDRLLAVELNSKEAEANEALFDCECCFTAVTFEELTACDKSGHLLCFQCVKHSINESVFGQGWQRNIDFNNGTLRCVAAMSDDCQGCIPRELVNRAFDDDKAGREIIQKLDERLVEDNLLKTNLPLIRCPFCSYAEVDELYVPESQRQWRLSRRIGASSLYTLVILVLGVGAIPFLLPAFLLLSFLFLLVSSRRTFGDYAVAQVNASVTRLRRKRHGLKFSCQSPTCGRSSCISCSKAWSDIHICHESSLLALRTQVELAMSQAIKRTCPRCNTSFVKSSGCNKLTCVCGYQMCYVCRKDIGNGEGYRHFCEHFRPNGGRGCTECSKCDLYRCEDDDVVVKKAKEEAERKWMEKEGTDLGDEKIRKVLTEKLKIDGKGSWYCCKWRPEMPDWEQLLDAMVEVIIE